MTGAAFLEVHGVTMAFPGVVALEGVSLSALRGEILGVVGENGAGKSTLMKILAGVYPDGSYTGEIRLEGAPLAFNSVADAEAVGIVLIPQELNVVPEFTVAEYVFLNREPRRFGAIDQRQMVSETSRLLADFGVDIAPTTRMRTLGTAQQQLVEIIKALAKQARIVILDEPTASLSVRESRQLFERLRDLKERGVTCLYVSHRLSEVLALADRVFVLRDGRQAGLDASAALTHDRVVGMMLGRDLEELFPKQAAEIGESLLELVDFSVPSPADPQKRVVEHVNLEVRAGEVVGLFGLVGAGRSELVMALFGAWPVKPEGEVRIRGQQVTPKDPERAIRSGIALLTEDRKRYGLIPAWDVEENITVASLVGLSRAGVVRRKPSRELAGRYVQRLGIKSVSLQEPALNLSGGNQQKVILGRWLARSPQVLVLDEPTRGIDVGAKVEVFHLLNELAGEGLGILFISSELEEILGMSDRILVMAGGRLRGEWPRAEATEERVLACAMGAAA
jgi:D-xylose transport system ATP-binding protein